MTSSYSTLRLSQRRYLIVQVGGPMNGKPGVPAMISLTRVSGPMPRREAEREMERLFELERARQTQAAH